MGECPAVGARPGAAANTGPPVPSGPPGVDLPEWRKDARCQAAAYSRSFVRISSSRRTMLARAPMTIAARKPLSAAVIRIVLDAPRSEEHTSELQSLMRTSYAV